MTGNADSNHTNGHSGSHSDSDGIERGRYRAHMKQQYS